MKEFIAVNDPYTLLNLSSAEDISLNVLKREALIFNRIAIPNLQKTFLSNKHVLDMMLAGNRDLDWLMERGIVFEPKLDYDAEITSEEYENTRESVIRQAKDLVSLILGFNVEELIEAREDELKKVDIKKKLENLTHSNSIEDVFKAEEFKQTAILMSGYTTRFNCIQLRELHGSDAYPVLLSETPFIKNSIADKDSVIQISLIALPIPDESISWEQIIEYRSDPDSQSKFLALRNWMSEVARAKLRPAEVAEKLEYLMDTYQRHMELHRMKTNTGTLETFIVTSAELLGDIFSFKWGKAAQALFSLKKRQVALLEGELTAPGSEVAYIVKARKSFAKQH